MPPITQDFLKDLRVAINAALAPVAKKHDITLKTGNCTFDPKGNFTFKLEGVANGGLDKRGALYESLRTFNSKLPQLRSSFPYKGETHEIVGANTTGTKVITTCKGRDYQFPVGFIEKLSESEPKGFLISPETFKELAGNSPSSQGKKARR